MATPKKRTKTGQGKAPVGNIIVNPPGGTRIRTTKIARQSGMPLGSQASIDIPRRKPKATPKPKYY